MPDLDKLARAICEAIVQQDDPGFTMPADWGCKIAYLDQGEVDFALVAQATATTLDRHRIERAGDVEVRLRARAGLTDLQANQDAFLEAAALITSLRAENARARQEGWNAAIEAVCAEFDGCDELDVVSIVRALASDAKGEG